MSKRIIIAGSGFAGLWAALAAQRAIHLASQEQNIEVMMVSLVQMSGFVLVFMRPCLKT